MTIDPATTTNDSPGTSTEPHRPLGIRGAFRRLSTGLLVYGAIGVVVALIGLAGVFWVTGRINTAEVRAAATLSELTATLERTSTALTDAGATADSFATTIDTSSTALSQAAATIRNVTPQLRALEAQFRAINILGAQPLARAADLMGQVASDVEGLDQRIDGVAATLLDNRDALATNEASLDALGTQMGTLAARLESGVIEESLADIQVLVTVLMLLFVMWTAVPAIGALVLGWWLRSELRRPGGEGSAQLVA